MHYVNGREAKTGDPVIVKQQAGEGYRFYAGTIHSLNAGTDACNGQVAVPTIGGCVQLYVTLKKEVLHAEDCWLEFPAGSTT